MWKRSTGKNTVAPNFFTGTLSSRLKQIHTRIRFFRKIWIYCVTGKPSRRWSSIPTSVKYCRSLGKSPVVYPYQIHGQQLKHSDCAKYLGVRISNDMHKSKHTDMVSSNANSTLGFIKRNVNISSRTIKEQAYKTLVRPVLEYSLGSI